MKRLHVVFLVVSIFAIVAVSNTAAQTTAPNNEKQTQWIANVLKDVQTIKVGMTRGEMRKVFGEEGGISTTNQRQYIYLGCPYIKVVFKFEPRGKKIKDAEGRLWQPESEQDVIKSISEPYLEFSIID